MHKKCQFNIKKFTKRILFMQAKTESKQSRTFRCRDIFAERVNCSKFLFLLFHFLSKNIANCNKCKRIYCKECMSQIRAYNN